MRTVAKLVAAGLAGFFAAAAFDVPTEARERSGVGEARKAKKAQTRGRVVRRPIVREAMPAYAAAPAYAGPPQSLKPYGGPGRAQFEPLVVGAPPERGETRSPEGP
jgi:hypothetical protein